MPIVQCRCGARYRVSDTAAGKRARCKKCGQTITVPRAAVERAESLDDLSALADGTPVQVARPTPPRAPDAAAAPAHLDALALGGGVSNAAVAPPPTVESGVPTGERYRLYFTAIGREFLLSMKFGNLVTFIVLWVIMSFQFPLMFAGCLGGIGILIIKFYFMAFCMNAVVDAAGGEDDLNQINFAGGWLAEVFSPGLRFLLAYLLVRVPAVACLLFMMQTGRLATTEATETMNGVGMNMFGSALAGAPAGDLLTVGALYLAGAFFWPIILLVAAVGGLLSLVRVDLIAKTIVRSLLPYLCTVGLVYLALALPLVYKAAGFAATENSDAGTVIVAILLSGIEIYATIVAVRVIGRYYHHFKDRFAWSWG